MTAFLEYHTLEGTWLIALVFLLFLILFFTAFPDGFGKIIDILFHGLGGYLFDSFSRFNSHLGELGIIYFNTKHAGQYFKNSQASHGIRYAAGVNGHFAEQADAV